MILDVTDAKYLKDYLIEVTFNDGKEGIADLSQSLQGTLTFALPATAKSRRALSNRQPSNIERNNNGYLSDQL